MKTGVETLNVREIAALLAIPKAEVYRLFDEGKLTVLRRDPEDRRIGLLRADAGEVRALRAAQQ